MSVQVDCFDGAGRADSDATVAGAIVDGLSCCAMLQSGSIPYIADGGIWPAGFWQTEILICLAALLSSILAAWIAAAVSSLRLGLTKLTLPVTVRVGVPLALLLAVIEWWIEHGGAEQLGFGVLPEIYGVFYVLALLLVTIPLLIYSYAQAARALAVDALQAPTFVAVAAALAIPLALGTAYSIVSLYHWSMWLNR